MDSSFQTHISVLIDGSISYVWFYKHTVAGSNQMFSRVLLPFFCQAYLSTISEIIVSVSNDIDLPPFIPLSRNDLEHTKIALLVCTRVKTFSISARAIESTWIEF